MKKAAAGGALLGYVLLTPCWLEGGKGEQEGKRDEGEAAAEQGDGKVTTKVALC